MIHENFAIVGAIIASIGGFLYLWDVTRGKVKPNKVTWFLWGFAPLVAFAAQIQKGVGLQSATTFAAGFTPLLIFIASFFNKKSEWKLTRFDYLCGGFSLLGLLFWYLSREGNVAIFFAIVADALAALPTIVKAYKTPESESGNIFLLNGVGMVITLLTIRTWDFANYGFPVYILLVCTFIFTLVTFNVKKLVESISKAR